MNEKLYKPSRLHSQPESREAAKQRIEALRLQLLANGYSPIPNRDKATYFKGWPSVEITPEAIAEWSRRHSRDDTTGLRVENGLAVIDLDVNDEIIDRIADAILDACPELDSADVPLLVRHGKGRKEAWFVRAAEPFTRIHTKTWIKPGETVEDGSPAHVEIFGGASSRQFGSFGWHTRPEKADGGAGIEYRWEDASPLNTPLAALPVLSKAQFFTIADAASRVLEAEGWVPVPMSTAGENDAVRVFDLTEDMTFDCDDDTTRTLAELREVAEDGLRCSAAWLEGPQAKRRDRCLVSLTRSGRHVAIYETASGVTHIEASAKLRTVQDAIKELREKFPALTRGRSHV